MENGEFKRPQEANTTTFLKESNMINWDQVGQQRFDRVVEAIVQRRFAGQVRAINGRGGDNGIDIRIEHGNQLNIMQLKYFPDGFSGGWAKTRRRQIKDSFDTAQQHQPDEWTLVVPATLTESEELYVKGLAAGLETHGPRISIVGRTDLDSWLADDPDLDTYLQRDPTTALAEYARVFGQESAALLGGIPDLAARVSNLGRVADTLDPNYAVDYTREGDTVGIAVRPTHPNAFKDNPIRVSFGLALGADDTELADRLERALDFGSSDSVEIPASVVKHLHVDGPDFIAGERTGTDIVIEPLASSSPAVGKPLQVRIFAKTEDQAPIAGWVGQVTYAERGPLGGSIDADFCNGKLQARFHIPIGEPNEIETAGTKPGVVMSFDHVDSLPSVVRDTLTFARQIRTAARIELYFDGMHATTLGAISNAEDDPALLVLEQVADDLDAVQRKLGVYFNMPDEITQLERIELRVARILLEGGIVASPSARVYVVLLNGTDTPDARAAIHHQGQFVHRARDPHAITLGDRTLTIGPIYVMHPAAIAINADEASDALDAGQGQNFQLKLRPGGDQFFYLALADRPLDDYLGQPAHIWGLSGINQPDIQISAGGDEPDTNHDT